MPSHVISYTIHRLLGRGGFGSVYQASAKGVDGSKRVVALKLVDPARITEDALAGLRDEARIAHILDDPAVVRVEPPMLVQGMWAIEMEFVDGASLHRILKEHHRVPPRPAVELVAEGLGALDRLVHKRGPDGHPLRLVHRDLKPGNVQLTPQGEVKLLDFGSAIADGVRRERPDTDTDAIIGTRGYIAPERFESIEHPKGDVYALGVLLHHLITGRLPGARSAQPPLAPEADEALVLAEHMRRRELVERMDAGEARARLMALHGTLRGPTLREWTSTVRPVPRGLPPDDLVGQTLYPTDHEMPLFRERRRGMTVTPAALLESDPVLSETGSLRSIPVPVAAARRGRPRWVVGLLLGVVLTLLVLACGAGVGASMMLLVG